MNSRKAAMSIRIPRLKVPIFFENRIEAALFYFPLEVDTPADGDSLSLTNEVFSRHPPRPLGFIYQVAEGARFERARGTQSPTSPMGLRYKPLSHPSRCGEPCTRNTCLLQHHSASNG